MTSIAGATARITARSGIGEFGPAVLRERERLDRGCIGRDEHASALEIGPPRGNGARIPIRRVRIVVRWRAVVPDRDEAKRRHRLQRNGPGTEHYSWQAHASRQDSCRNAHWRRRRRRGWPPLPRCGRSTGAGPRRASSASTAATARASGTARIADWSFAAAATAAAASAFTGVPAALPGSGSACHTTRAPLRQAARCRVPSATPSAVADASSIAASR